MTMMGKSSKVAPPIVNPEELQARLQLGLGGRFADSQTVEQATKKDNNMWADMKKDVNSKGRGMGGVVKSGIRSIALSLGKSNGSWASLWEAFFERKNKEQQDSFDRRKERSGQTSADLVQQVGPKSSLWVMDVMMYLRTGSLQNGRESKFWLTSKRKVLILWEVTALCERIPAI